MGLMDKVKEQAGQVAAKAKEAAKAGEAKLEEVQAKRRMNALLRDLGAAVYAERTGKGTAQTASETERLLAELRDLEAAGMPVEATDEEDEAG